jgi:hypothetical protein
VELLGCQVDGLVEIGRTLQHRESSLELRKGEFEDASHRGRVDGNPRGPEPAIEQDLRECAAE